MGSSGRKADVIYFSCLNCLF